MIMIYSLSGLDGRVRYIGASSKDAVYVLSHHRSAAKSPNKRSPVNVWVNDNGGLVELTELAVVEPEQKAAELKRIIQDMRDAGAELLNLTAEEHAERVKVAMDNPVVRAKIASATKGRVNSAEHREAISRANRGRVISDEHKAIISRVHTGKIVSEETRAKIAARALGHKRNEGHVHTQESKDKMSKTKCDRQHADKAIRKSGCRWCEARYS